MFERRLYYHIDWPLIIAIIALCSLGVLMIYSTTFDPTRGTSRMYATQLYAIIIAASPMTMAYSCVMYMCDAARVGSDVVL